ncbi:MAG: hypothetical protein M0Q15_06250 [Nevskia sp.]|nr:hypothetical protein [Nevskia sp.]
MSILKNAIDSIAVGLEDYSSPDQRRVISCTRNVFAGILLLFKHKLSLLSLPGSDEALIKQRVLPVLDASARVEWKGKGSKTVDVQGIRERFESLIIDVDWKRIEKINSFRNDIEHYFSNLKHEAIRSLISDSFVIINDFIRKHLNEDPKELLGDAAWAVLIEVNEVYEKEKAECLAKKTIRLRATGKVAWAIAAAAIGLAVYAALGAPATGGTSLALESFAAPAAIGILGFEVTFLAIAVAVAAGGIGALTSLRRYKEISRTSDTLVLSRR